MAHLGNAGLVLYVECTLPTDNANETKKASARQGEDFLFPCKMYTLFLVYAPFTDAETSARLFGT